MFGSTLLVTAIDVAELELPYWVTAGLASAHEPYSWQRFAPPHSDGAKHAGRNGQQRPARARPFTARLCCPAVLPDPPTGTGVFS
ncbi:hypothetical protein AB0I93_27500 [Streptomyces sp. NPDC049967]|uniref:hypothetical protein n=1 Tax=unclassified Streptomyces TaxID=2593676 RepID=UPI002E0E5275|nr:MULTISPECIES: hypothetical protein [unclassified Streptomyces]WSJ23067.1 hypothetical protein OG384_14275 [Streptomyces sp. NBC_01324]